MAAIKDPDNATLTASEKITLKVVAKLDIYREYIIKQAYYLARLDARYGEDISRTNLTHRMASLLLKKSKGQFKQGSFSYFRKGHVLVSVAHQMLLNDEAEESPLLATETQFRGMNPHVVVGCLFIPLDQDRRFRPEDGAEKRKPLFKKTRDTLYKHGHVLGKAYDVFSSDLTDEIVMIGKYSANMLMSLYLNSSDYNDDSEKRKETPTLRLARADAAIDYIVNHVCGKPICFAPVPDSRARVAKHRVFFADTYEELDVQHTWFINWFGEAWQTALYEYYNQYEVGEAAMEDMRVALARGYHKSRTSQRLSWQKALNFFKKKEANIVEWGLNEKKHGFYYRRMARIYKAGIGTMTGFMIESDLSASGIGSLAMNMGNLPMAKEVCLAGTLATNDAHRGITEDIMHAVIDDRAEVDKLIHRYYKQFKKLNTELAHGQTAKTTAMRWMQQLAKYCSKDVPICYIGTTTEYPVSKLCLNNAQIKASSTDNFFKDIAFGEVTEEMISDLYEVRFPGMIEWIAEFNSLATIGVERNIHTLFYHMPDGVKSASPSYTVGRQFKTTAVDFELKSRTIDFQMRMPIEVDAGRIVWSTPYQQKLTNKLISFFANSTQSEDAYGKRKISKEFKAKYDYVPVVKHDGYHVRLGDSGNLTEVAYDWRAEQLVEKPSVKAYREICTFLGLGVKKLRIKPMGMKLSDLKFSNVKRASFMMT